MDDRYVEMSLSKLLRQWAEEVSFTDAERDKMGGTKNLPPEIFVDHQKDMVIFKFRVLPKAASGCKSAV